MKFNRFSTRKLHERQAPAGASLLAATGLLVFFLLVATAFRSAHPFYLSVTELAYKADQRELQVSCKIFTDDFEDALKAAFNRRVVLTDDAAKAANQAFINQYLRQHLKLAADGKALSWELLGFEQEQEATWIYLVVKKTLPFRQLQVTNDVLFDLRPGQVNIIHCRLGGERQSYRLTAPQSTCVFNW